MKLLTGKTHQIRAQLKACGYPLVGDPKYGTIEDTARKPCPGRQFLHAWKLIFPECTGTLETLSGKSFTAPVPADLKQTAEEFGILLPDHE